MPTLPTLCITGNSNDDEIRVSHQEIFKRILLQKLRQRKIVQTDQLNPFFHTFSDLAKRIGPRHNTDCLISNFLSSTTKEG